VGMAIATFEKLEPLDQELIKTAACISEATGHFGPFTTVDLQRGLHEATEEEIHKRCHHLVEVGILRNGACADAEPKGFGFGRLSMLHKKAEPTPDAHTFRFTSRLLRHVASMLVLQVKRDDVNNEDFGQRKTDHHVPYNPSSTTELDAAAAALLSIATDDDDDDDDSDY